jgi:hypothetical protein
VCKLGAQSINGRSQNETDGLRVEVTRYAQEGDEFLDFIVTGDKTLVFQHIPESKQQPRRRHDVVKRAGGTLL